MNDKQFEGSKERITRFLLQGMGKDTPVFPKGKLNEDDQGELAYAVYVDEQNKVVKIDFNKSVNWLALDLESALAMHTVLTTKIRKLYELENRNPDTKKAAG